MRVIFFNKWGESSAAYRCRLASYLPYLRSKGIECVVSSLDKEGSLARLKWLARPDFDVAVIFHELFPHVPWAFEERLLKIPYVFDFDDAIQVLETPFTRGKTARLIEGARITIAGSEELVKFAAQYGSDVRLIPTVINLARYQTGRPAPKQRKDRRFTIGWIGTPESAHSLQIVAEPLREIQATLGARVVAIGSGPIELKGVKVECRAWSEKTELRELASFDVGIMPLEDDPWTRGKCGCKLVQYLAMGIPQVASPIGANTTIVADSKTGFLAKTPEDWVRSLEQLANDPPLRAKMGKASLKRSEAHYCVERTAPLFHQALLDAMAGAGPKRRMQTNS